MKNNKNLTLQTYPLHALYKNSQTGALCLHYYYVCNDIHIMCTTFSAVNGKYFLFFLYGYFCLLFWYIVWYIYIYIRNSIILKTFISHIASVLFLYTINNKNNWKVEKLNNKLISFLRKKKRNEKEETIGRQKLFQRLKIDCVVYQCWKCISYLI